MGKGTERDRERESRPTKELQMGTRTEDEGQDRGVWRRGEYAQGNPETLWT